MKRGPVKGLVNDINSWAELVLVRERIYKVEPAAEIDRELFERLPLVLQIETVEVAVLVVIIDDAQRGGAGLVAIGIDRKNKRSRIDGRVLLGENKTAANRMLVVEFVARIEFDAVGKNVAIHPRGNAVKNEVADVVRAKKDRTEAIED